MKAAGMGNGIRATVIVVVVESILMYNKNPTIALRRVLDSTFQLHYSNFFILFLILGGPA